MVGTLIVSYATGLTLSAVAASATLTAVAFAINFAVSAIVSRVFAPKPDRPQDMGVREQVPPSNVNAVPVVYGDAYLGGTFVDAVLSEDQKVMYYVLAVSSISPDGQFSFDQSKLYYGDRLATFSAVGTVVQATVQSGGTGYTVGDVLTVSGGTPTIAAELTVTQVSAGQIVSVSISNAGSYGAGTNPNNPALVTGGTGSDAKFILKYSAYGPNVQALSDEAGNVDTAIKTGAAIQPLEIYLFTSDQAGNVTRINSVEYPWDIMGGSDIVEELRWPSTGRRMNGLAFAIVRLTYNRDAQTTNLFPITFHASHYLRGTGVAKPGDVWFDYITNAQYGGAVDAAFVDSSARIALNTYSDEVITFDTYVGTPSTQPRYRFNGVLDAGQTVLSNLDRIMSCCDSWLAYSAALGQWSVAINKAEAPAFAFNDDNIIGEVRVSATDITQSVNQVEAKFPDKDNRDQPNFVNLETPSGLLYPNEPVNKSSITYDLVNDSVQAQYLANRVLEQAREDLIVSFNTTYQGIQIDAGAVVAVTNADYGWTNKLFRVIKVNEASLPDGSLGARLEMNEYSAAVYDDFNITQYTPVPNSDLPSVYYFSPLSAPTVTASNPASAIPNFNVSISIPASGRVTYIELYYTTAAIPSASDWKLLSIENSVNGESFTPSSTYVFTNQVLPTGASATETYYFSFRVGNETSQSPRSPISASFTWDPERAVAPSVDISGFTGFSRSITGVFTPVDALLTADILNIDSPTYLWAVTGATPASGTSSTITITPSVGAASISVVLTVDGTNLPSPLSRSIILPIVDDGATGATGPIGPEGPPGATGADGARNAQVYFFYNTATASAPTAPTTAEVAYNFTTQTATITAAGWSTLFNPSGQSTVSANNKWWSVKVVFQEIVVGGAYTETISPVFVWENFDGLVTFTNLSTAQGPLGTGTTFIDGGSIITQSLNANRISSGNMSAGSAANANISMGQTGTVIGSLQASLNVRKLVADTGLINIGAQNNTDGNVTIWGHSANNAVGSGNGVSGSHTTSNTFSSWQRLGALGSGLKDAGVWGLAYNSVSTSVAGVFERFDGTSSLSPGSLSKTVSLATSSYAAYSPSGGGKYYFVDGVGPFTAYHEGMLPLATVVEQGDILVDTTIFYRCDISNVLFNVTLSSSANEAAPIGVVSDVLAIKETVPGIIWEYQVEPNPDPNAFAPRTFIALKPGFNLEELQSTYKVAQINSIGEGQINVCGENGNLAKGDLIVTSSIPGKGMRQSDDIVKSYTVARAREAVSFASPTEVKLIACIYLCG